MSGDQVATLDKEVRRYVYDHTMREELPPTVAELASALSTTSDAVGASFQRLADGHILVLQQGTGEILMAFPLYQERGKASPGTATVSGMLWESLRN